MRHAVRSRVPDPHLRSINTIRSASTDPEHYTLRGGGEFRVHPETPGPDPRGYSITSINKVSAALVWLCPHGLYFGPI